MGFFGETSKKVLMSLAAVGAAAGIAGLGSFATFTSSTSATQATGSGTVAIALGATGALTNRLTVAAAGLVPGDTVQRSVTLSNTGNQDLASIRLTTTASPSSLLDSDTVNGLQMELQRCTLPWVEVGVSPAFTYTCAGVTTTVLASRPVIGSSIDLPGLSALTVAGADNLRVTLTLPAIAVNALQGLSSSLTYTFVGTQRSATNR